MSDSGNYVAAMEAKRSTWNATVFDEVEALTTGPWRDLAIEDFLYGWMVRGYSEGVAFDEMKLHLEALLTGAANRIYQAAVVEIQRRRDQEGRI